MELPPTATIGRYSSMNSAAVSAASASDSTAINSWACGEPIADSAFSRLAQHSRNSRVLKETIKATFRHYRPCTAHEQQRLTEGAAIPTAYLRVCGGWHQSAPNCAQARDQQHCSCQSRRQYIRRLRSP